MSQTTDATTLDSKPSEVDIWMIRENLKLSFEQRVAQHQQTLDCIDELKKIGRAHRAKTPKISN